MHQLLMRLHNLSFPEAWCILYEEMMGMKVKPELWFRKKPVQAFSRRLGKKLVAGSAQLSALCNRTHREFFGLTSADEEIIQAALPRLHH